jgi:hypothetical protein
MFGAEQGHEFNLGRPVQHVDRGLKLPVHPRGIRNQANPFADELLEAVLGKNLVAQFHLGLLNGLTSGKDGNQERCWEQTAHRGPDPTTGQRMA